MQVAQGSTGARDLRQIQEWPKSGVSGALATRIDKHVATRTMTYGCLAGCANIADTAIVSSALHRSTSFDAAYCCHRYRAAANPRPPCLLTPYIPARPLGEVRARSAGEAPRIILIVACATYPERSLRHLPPPPKPMMPMPRCQSRCRQCQCRCPSDHMSSRDTTQHHTTPRDTREHTTPREITRNHTRSHNTTRGSTRETWPDGSLRHLRRP